MPTDRSVLQWGGATLATNAPLPSTLARFEHAAGEAPDREVCRRVATDIMRTRNLRHRYLIGFHLADPVWDMLLDLYVAEAKRSPVSISDLAIAAGVPRSTGVRWVANLISEGKLQAEADVADGRRTWVTLSPASRAALEKYLHEAARAGSRSLNNNRTDRV